MKVVSLTTTMPSSLVEEEELSRGGLTEGDGMVCNENEVEPDILRSFFACLSITIRRLI